ncbi:MAG: FtsX-like permease family protein [Acidobacteriota bacterium]
MTGLWNLLRFISIYRFWQAKVRTALSVGGIVLGVATIVAVGGMNDSILASFKRTVDEVSGRTEIEISGGKTGFSEDVSTAVQDVQGVKAQAPILEATGIYRAPDGTSERIYIMGIDTLGDRAFRDYKFTDGSMEMTDPLEFLNATDSLILTEQLAAKLHLKLDDTVPLVTATGTKDFVLRGLLKPEGPAKTFGGAMGLMDVYSAQIAFEREKRLDRIDVIAKDPERIDDLIAALKRVVPSGLEVRRPYQRSGYVTKLLRSFKSGLDMGSMLALLTGTFLIYNTIGISVVQRRKEIGVLRSVGVSRRRIKLLFTLEAAVMGIVGALCGIPLGMLLSRVMLGAVSKIVSQIYLRVDVKQLVIDPRVLIGGGLLGIAATFVAALYPATQASRVTVLETLRVTSFDVSRRQGTWRSFAVGLGFFALAAFLCRLPPVSHFPLGGYLGALAILLGVSFMTPAFLIAFRAVARPLSGRLFRVLGALAADNLVKAIGRTSITVAALMIGLSMMVSVVAFLRSIKGSMEEWIDSSINANLIVAASSRVVGPSSTQMGPSLGAKLEAYHGVKDVTYFRMFNVSYGADSVILMVSVDLSKWLKYNRLIEMGGSVSKGLPKVLSGEAVFVSDNFAALYGVKPGQSIELPTATGRHAFEVAAVVRDFTSDSGVVIGDRALTKKYWGDAMVDSYGMYLEKGTDEIALRETVARDLGVPYNLNVLTNKEFRGDIDQIVNNSFLIAYMLGVLSLLISLLGIVNTLLAEVIDRTRVLGVLRAIGSTRGQIKRLVMLEAGLLGMAGNVLGILTGAILSVLLIFVLNAQNTGWVVDYHFPLAAVAFALSASTLVAIVAGYYPASRAAKLDIVTALEYE